MVKSEKEGGIWMRKATGWVVGVVAGVGATCTAAVAQVNTVSEAVESIGGEVEAQLLPTLVAVGAVVAVPLVARFGYSWIRRAVSRG